MADPLRERLESVTDERTFVRFVEALAADFAADQREQLQRGTSPLAPGPRGWENGNVDQFLEAAVAWVEDSRSRPAHAENPWHRCAEILLAGKGYD